MVKVVIAAESALARKGIEQLLFETDVEIVASIGLVSELEMELEQVDAADVMVCVAEPSSLTALARELAQSDMVSDLPIVVLAEFPDPRMTMTALRLGIRAVLSADIGRAQLLAALHAVSVGLVVTSADEIDGIISSDQKASAATGVEELLEPLTPRELEVLRVLALGLANKEIGSKLGISEHTVKFHVAAILGKLGASSRTEAVAIGIRRGLIFV